MHIHTWRAGTFIALFLLAVGVILGSVPGWGTVEFVWQVVGCLVLVLLILARIVAALVHAVRCEWPRLRGDGVQMLVLAGAIAALTALSRLSDWVEMVHVSSTLRAQADASVRSGGLPMSLAWDGSGWPAAGTLYDRTREVDKPPLLRSPAWRASVIGARFEECISLRHLVGPWYRWSDACSDT